MPDYARCLPRRTRGAHCAEGSHGRCLGVPVQRTARKCPFAPGWRPRTRDAPVPTRACVFVEAPSCCLACLPMTKQNQQQYILSARGKTFHGALHAACYNHGFRQSWSRRVMMYAARLCCCDMRHSLSHCFAKGDRGVICDCTLRTKFTEYASLATARGKSLPEA